MKLLDQLNDPQRESVETTDGPLLVLAGAGSGKTRVLTFRIAHLVQNLGVPPRHILAFTFTNKAAGEMKARLAYLLGGSPLDLWVGTFHSTGVRVLRRSGAALGIAPSFTIYDTDDQESLLRQILKDAPQGDRDLTPKAVRAAISSAKNAFVSPAEFAQVSESFRAERLAALYAEYERRRRAANALDFDDLIGEPVRLFEQHPQVRAEYAERFRYVLVDEYQDTNTAQIRFIDHLASRHRNLCVVGDDDQSIYGWRGADVRHILDFESRYPETRVVRLEQNYRSTGNILAAANAVVRVNRARKEKTLWTEREPGDRVQFFLAGDEEEEASRVVATVNLEAGRRGVSPSEIAVLYRTNAQSRALETAFRYAAIPYDLVGGTAFYERREVKDLLAYLRLLVNEQDDVAFLRAVQVPRRGIGATTLDRLVAHAAREGTSLLLSLDRLDMALEIPAGARQKLVEFRAFLGELRREDQNAAQLLEEIVTRTGYLDFLESDEPDTAMDRRENVAELVAGARVFVERQPPGDAASFLSEVALLTDLDRVDETAEKVRLMTIHNAKGLEFRVVFVPGCEEGLIPHASSQETEADLEEERRLFYVALTRAQDRVTLLAAARRFRWGGGGAALVSRFVEEIPEALLDREESERPAPARYRTSPSPAPRRRPEPGYPAGPRRSLGTILHPSFGRGEVVEQEGKGPDARLTVLFPGGVRKKILARYAEWEESHVDF